MTEDIALAVLFDLTLKQIRDGCLEFVDKLKLRHVQTWLSENADGQRVDPNGTPLIVVGVV